MKRSNTTNGHPVTTTTTTTRSSYKPPSIPLFLLSLFSLFCVIHCCVHFRNKMSIWLLYALLVVDLYLGLHVAIGWLRLIGHYMVGVDTYPAHNAPFMASSLSDFWGKRWNHVATTILRASVYDPILFFLCSLLPKKKDMNGVGAFRKVKNESVHMQKQGVKRASSDDKTSSNAIDLVANHGEIRNRPPLAAKTIALIATFVFSGLIHEAIFCCITRSHATWEATAFFILHGVATVLELALRHLSNFPDFSLLVLH